MGINVEDIRKISNKKNILNIAIKEVEEEIKKSAKKGKFSICYGPKELYGGRTFYINGKSYRLPEVKEHFIIKGFKFRDTGIIAGVYQHTEDLYW